MTPLETPLDATIDLVLTSRQQDLGLSASIARAAAEAIEASDRDDADAMRAHELLMRRFKYGRAW